ncbi:hypothetical protein MBLNU457_1699t1 [Dothideomycetes sp. NU457]
MPTQWNASIHEWMFKQILNDERHKFTKDDWDRIVKNWPAKFGATPTIRAVGDHIATFKKQSDNGTGAATSARGPKVAKTPKTPKSADGAVVKSEGDNESPTPGPLAARPKSKGAAKSPAKKRKRASEDEDEESMTDRSDDDDATGAA